MSIQSSIRFLILGSVLVFSSIGAFAASSSAPLSRDLEYQALTALQKQEILWQRIHENPYPADSLPTQAPFFGWKGYMFWYLQSPKFLISTFTNVSDEMPEGRPRYIHTYGAAGLVQFVPNPASGYSGLFQSASPIPGVVRLSLASLREDLDKDDFVPGIALKLLIDGKPSENVVAIYSLNGQGTNANFFANQLTTTIAPPTGSILIRLAKAFAKTLESLDKSIRPINERTIPVDRLAHILPDGRPVVQEVQSPAQLVFVPSGQVANRINPTDTHTDTRIRLGELEENTVLYRVYDRPVPNADTHDHYLGEIVLTSKLIASPYVDQKLFFQHLVRWSN